MESGRTHLHQQGVAEPQCALQVLPEGVIQEAGPRDLTVLVLVHNELRGLSGGVNDQRVPADEAEEQAAGANGTCADMARSPARQAERLPLPDRPAETWPRGLMLKASVSELP